MTDTLNYSATSNRISTVTRPGLGNRTFTYDNAGNILTDNGPGGNKTYVYNKRNRLSQATVGALIYNYTYNAQEQLAVRTSPSAPTTTHFIHDRMGNVITETAGGGPTGTTGTTREYIYLYETEIAPTMGSRTVVDRPLAVVDAVNSAPVVYNVSVDHLNRPVLMTNAAKSPVWTAIWQPWGGVHSITGSATLNSRFPGQWFQAETGLHYNWHRSYDPTLGRYTQPDPLGFVDGPSVYGYAGGSPMRYVDRDGRFADGGASAAVTLLGMALAYYCLSNNDDECEKAKADAQRLYDEIVIKRIPQYRYGCRNDPPNSTQDTHYNAIIAKITALEKAIRMVEAKCPPERYGPNYPKWKRLVDVEFPKCH